MLTQPLSLAANIDRPVPPAYDPHIYLTREINWLLGLLWGLLDGFSIVGVLFLYRLRFRVLLGR